MRLFKKSMILVLLFYTSIVDAQQLEGLNWGYFNKRVNSINYSNQTLEAKNQSQGTGVLEPSRVYSSICDSNGNMILGAELTNFSFITNGKGKRIISENPRFINNPDSIPLNPTFTGRTIYFAKVPFENDAYFAIYMNRSFVRTNGNVSAVIIRKRNDTTFYISNERGTPFVSPNFGFISFNRQRDANFNFSMSNDLSTYYIYLTDGSDIIHTKLTRFGFEGPLRRYNIYPIPGSRIPFYPINNIYISTKQDRLVMFDFSSGFTLFKINPNNGDLYERLKVLNLGVTWTPQAIKYGAFSPDNQILYFSVAGERKSSRFIGSNFAVKLDPYNADSIKASLKSYRSQLHNSTTDSLIEQPRQFNPNGDLLIFQYLLKSNIRNSYWFMKVRCPNEWPPVYIDSVGSIPFTFLRTIYTPQLSTVVFRNADKFQVMATRRIICVGDTTSLRAFGATVDRFRWQGPPGLNNDTIWDPTFRAIAPGFYTWNVSGSSVCTTATNSITVQVVERLPSNLLGNDVSICPANSRVLSVQNQQAGWSYRWNTGATSPSISIDSVGIYWVEVSNGGCTVRDSIRVSQAAQPPVPVVTASTLALCAGQETELAGPVGTNLSYLWNTGDTTRVIRVGAGVYSLRVVNTLSGCTSLVSNSVEIIALPAPPLPEVLASGPTRFCEGGQVSLSGPVGNFRYRWNTGDTSRVILVNRSGTFRLRLISSLGCEGPFSLATVVSVEPKPNGSIFGPNIVCPSSEGTVFRFVPNDSGISIDSLNFQWSVVGGTIVSSGGDSVIIRWPSGRSDTAKIQVLATSRLGCVGDTVSLNIRINPRLEPLIPQGPNSLCSNASIGNYSAPRTIGSTYNWNIVGGTILSGQGSNRVAVNWNPIGPWSLSYQERLTTSDTICEGSSPVLNITISPSPREDLSVTGPTTFCGVATTQISLLGEGSSTYRWEVGELIIQGDSNRSSINLQAPRVGVYPIRVQETNSFGCSGPFYLDTLRFNPVPLAIAGENISFCANGSGVLGATNNPELTYRWEPNLGLDNANISQPRVNLNQSGEYVYRLIVQNSFGCLDTSEVRVNVFALPSKPTVSGNPSACEGDTVVLRVNNPQTGNTYRWLSNTGAISGNVIRVNTSQQVILEARNTSGCSTLGDTLNIIIYPLPPKPSISLQTDSLLCEGEPFQLSGPPASGYRWSNGANTQSQSLTGSQQISLRTLSVEGCLSPPSNPVNLRYLDVPLPSLAHNNPLLCPEKLSGTYSVKGGIGSTYQFSVAGGTITSSNDTSVTINFEQGNITRSLTVIETTERGCLSGPITLSFQVDELLENPTSPCQLSDFPPIIPNIITPNADGFNDRFEVKNLRYYPNAELVIFNRFGKQLFQLQPYDNSFSAASLPAGTYYYLFHSGRGQTFKGWVEVGR